MAEWKHININSNMIKAESDKAVLVACPNESRYSGYSFWHSSKCVRSGRHRASVELSYTEDFTFKLMKYGKGKNNQREVLDTKVIDAEEFEDLYDVTDSNIKAKEDGAYLIVEEPEKVDKEVQVIESLKNE